VVIDECDTLEQVLGGFIEISIGPRIQQEYGIREPDKKTVSTAWQAWVEPTATQIQWHLNKLQSAFDNSSDTEQIILGRRLNSLSRLSSSFDILKDEDHGIQSGNWVYTGYENGYINFKPIRFDALAGRYLWRHATKFLLMSATIISSDVMAESLGI
jgi:hypothetical protein